MLRSVNGTGSDAARGLVVDRDAHEVADREHPDDVAAVAWRVVHERRRLPRSPHRTVGRQTRVLAAASAVSPDWANRLVVARLAR